MRTTLRQIGGSKGITIPATLIKEYGFGGEVELTATNEGLMIRPLQEGRKGWEEDARRIGASAEERALPDFYADEDELEAWEW